MQSDCMLARTQEGKNHRTSGRFLVLVLIFVLMRTPLAQCDMVALGIKIRPDLSARFNIFSMTSCEYDLMMWLNNNLVI